MASLSPIRGRATKLTGRRSERDLLERLVEAVRGGAMDYGQGRA
jgi:hypothetical protein